jgi:hypothetical protein
MLDTIIFIDGKFKSIHEGLSYGNNEIIKIVEFDLARHREIGETQILLIYKGDGHAVVYSRQRVVITAAVSQC